MGNSYQHFEVEVLAEENQLKVTTIGYYSLVKVMNALELAIDSAVERKKEKILIDASKVEGENISLHDRFTYGEHLSQYYIKHGLGKIFKIAVVSNENISDKRRFGETVATNRGVNVKIFENMDDALQWLK